MKDNSKLFAKLKELNELKEQNLITAELYEQKRKEILGRINNSNTINNTAFPNTSRQHKTVPPESGGYVSSTQSSKPLVWILASIYAVIVAGIIYIAFRGGYLLLVIA